MVCRELCAIHKPGQVAVKSSVILAAAKMATERAEVLHALLKDSLAQLEVDVIAARTVLLDKVRAQREGTFDIENSMSSNMDISGVDDYTGGGGIARDDPMLAWASLHQAAGLRETS